MRDDFTGEVKEKLAKRVGYLCSSPGCRAHTSGPQEEDDGSAVSVGRAAHITAAAPGGPRHDPSLTSRQRAAQRNGIWLCAICADKVDKDPPAYPVELLRRWKADAELAARQRLGKAKPPADPFRARERQIKRDLKTRQELERAMLKPFDPKNPNRKPCDALVYRKIIIRSVEDTRYPDVDPAPSGRISSWFRVEPYSFYHGGLMVILNLSRGIYSDSEQWQLIEHDAEFDRALFREIQIWTLGKIPWRNIRTCAFRGDEYYNEPHFFCAFADNGEPYEGLEYRILGETYDWPLDPRKRIGSEDRS